MTTVRDEIGVNDWTAEARAIVQGWWKTARYKSAASRTWKQEQFIAELAAWAARVETAALDRAAAIAEQVGKDWRGNLSWCDCSCTDSYPHVAAALRRAAPAPTPLAGHILTGPHEHHLGVCITAETAKRISQDGP